MQGHTRHVNEKDLLKEGQCITKVNIKLDKSFNHTF